MGGLLKQFSIDFAGGQCVSVPAWPSARAGFSGQTVRAYGGLSLYG
jgi:hypothetical protein